MVFYKCSREQNRKTGYSQHKEEFIMIKVAIEKNFWRDYRESAWGGARNTLDNIEKQGREEEAMSILEDYFSEDRLGHIPSEIEVNDFIWFKLPDIMLLYDEDEEE